MASVRTILGAVLLGALVALGCAAALFAQPAPVSADCATPGFAASFDRRFTGCEEVTRIPIRWRGHSAEMVVLKTEGLALNARTNEVISHLRRTADRVGAGLDEMGGDFELETIFVMLTDERSAMNGADAYAYPPNSWPDQCHVSVFVGSTGGDPDYVTFVMAHEMFHCVQMATWEDGEGLACTGEDELEFCNSWWVEGSAEYFANLAFPGTNHSSYNVTDFHSKSGDTSLINMSYENVVLFSWIDQRLGPPRVRAFLQRVANSADPESARAAAEAALSPDQWLEFAKFYVAGDIQLPGGVDVGPPTDMPIQGPEEPLVLAGGPLILLRATLAYEPGRYDNLIDRRDGLFAVRHNGEWGDLPEQLDVSCDAQKNYVFAAISAGADGVNNIITPSRTEERSCTPCDAAPRQPIRSCLVGTWDFPGHQDFCTNMTAQLAQSGARVVACNPGTGEVTFAADGTATSSATGQHITVSMAQGLSLVIDQQMQSRGRWAVDGDALQLCQATSTLTGTQTVTGGGQTRTNPVNQTAPTNAAGATVACTQTHLTITSATAPGAFLGIGPEMVLTRRR